MDTVPEANKFSAHFRAMAARIEKQDEKEFAGAVLIVPPTGEPIAVMITDPSKDPEAFLAVAMSRIQIAQQEIMSAKQGGAGAWGARR